VAYKSKKSGSSKTVDLVLERLNSKTRPERGKKTLVLTLSTYEVFERICREKKHYPSDVIDEFIGVFVEGLDGGGEA
jgi:hypothetical protein